MIPGRGAGLLLHVTSLPSRFGIGDAGPAAYRFVSALSGADQTFWQVLPPAPDTRKTPLFTVPCHFGFCIKSSPDQS